MDELKYMNLKGLENIDVPEGLEDRLSMKIDQWAAEEENKVLEMNDETAVPSKGKRIRFNLFRTLSVAASIAIVVCITAVVVENTRVNPAHKDTFDDPQMACAEAQKALSMLAYNLNRGVEHLEMAREISARTNNTINNTLKSLE